LFIYPLKISSEELAKFNDTLNLWKTREDSYRFFTNNCVDGIYNLLKSTLDSIQEAPIILTPQNLIRLLNESGKIGEQNVILQNNMQIPHKYSRFDMGALFFDKPYMNLRFRLFLHDFSDYGGYYSNFINFEALALNLYFNSSKINFKELWFIRIRSEKPSYNFISDWSWLIESGIEEFKITNFGLGKTYLIFNNYSLAYLFRGSILGNKQDDYCAGFQIAARGFSSKKYRFGAYFDYLRRLAKHNEIRTNSGMWVSFDLTEGLNLFAENSIKNYSENSFSLMLRFYLGL
jgi:hypothetical protein